MALLNCLSFILCLLLSDLFRVDTLHSPISSRLASKAESSVQGDRHTASHARLEQPRKNSETEWNLGKYAFSLLPLSPGDRRKTLFKEVVKGSIWTADQIQGVVNVNVPVRSVIVKLSEGGLLVYNPVGPTKELRDYIKGLEQRHGNVKHIVLGSLGLEHKALAGPFCQYFQNSQVWQQPGQWSFPVNLPSWFFGFPFGSKLQTLPTDFELEEGKRNNENPFSADFDMQVLGPLYFKSVGGFGETALFHRSTGTLLVTDAVITVGDTPPDIIAEDPRSLLFHARDSMLEKVEDTPEVRARGWRRMALFGLCFYPSKIDVESPGKVVSMLSQVEPDMAVLGQGAIPGNGGLYPWSWRESEESSFRALQGKGGRTASRSSPALLVAPILQKLILNREPGRVLKWADKVSQWPIKRIIPAHFENDIKADGRSFRNAFNFLETGYAAFEGSGGSGSSSGGGGLSGLSFLFNGRSSTKSAAANAKANLAGATSDDLALLDVVSEVFTKLGIVAPARVP